MAPESYPEPPSTVRAIVLVDGQNLFHCAREAFGYTSPNYDVLKLAQWVCKSKGWHLAEARFYTGIPSDRDDPKWNTFWSGKLLATSRQGVITYSRTLRYREKKIAIKAGASLVQLVGEEKGIDVRMAIDLIRMAHRNRYDVAVVFSQDQDLSEVANEIQQISREQRRWLRMASAYPVGGRATNTRGIDKTDWIPIDRASYDSCIDPYDYFGRYSKAT